jgi:hypothetical protein
MKKLTLLFIAIFAITTSTFAQNKPIYINIAYHKLKPGHTVEEAIALEKRWKVIQEKRKSAGLITGWAAYTILNEYKSESVDYDYVSMNASYDLNTITQYPLDMFQALVKEDPSLYTLVEETAKVQSVMRNKLTKAIEYTGSSNDMNSVVLMETMKTTTTNYFAYIDFEKQVKAIHMDRIKAGNIQEWAFWQHLAPFSDDAIGQFTAVTFFKDLSKLDEDSSPSYISGAKKYMNLTVDQYLKKADSLRKINQAVLLKYAVGTFN